MGDLPAQGLLASLRTLLETGVQLARVRVELLGNELEEQKLRLAHGLVLAVAGVLMLLVAVLLACGFVLLLVQEGHRLAALGVMAVAVTAGGVALLRAGSTRLRSPAGVFPATLEELRRDGLALRSGAGPQP
jgi:uncharacterized membrane protein YqjE